MDGGKLLALLLLGMMLLSSLSILDTASQDSKRAFSLVYTSHAYISIIDNYQFTGANGVVSGSGAASDPYIIEGWDIGASVADGIYIASTDAHFIVRDCYVHDVASTHAGIHLSSSTNGTISNNSCSSNQFGILLDSSGDCTISDNNCSGNDYGIEFFSSSDNTLSNNNCSSENDLGIVLTSSGDCTVSGNNCSGNRGGIDIGVSSSDTLTNNTMIGSGIVLDGSDISQWNTHSIDTSNIVNGKPVYYYKNQSGITVPAGAGQVILANCTDFIIEDQNLSDCRIGIEIGFSSGITITHNNCSSDIEYGIYLDSSNNCVVSNNSCSNNGEGIWLWSSINNTICDNDCNFNNYAGINLYLSSDSTVSDNNCSSNAWYGITLYSSSYSTISNNSCISNQDNGINLLWSSNNTVSENRCGSNVEDGIALNDSLNSKLLSNVCSNNGNGIGLYGGSNNNLANNSCSNNHNGIYISSEGDNTLTNNSCLNNYNGICIDLSSVDSLPLPPPPHGHNNLTDNNCSSNDNDGIYLYLIFVDNSITRNAFYNNAHYGVEIVHGSKNLIWNNTFIGNNGASDKYNASHIQAWDNGTSNAWNSSNGYGNYWSDWTKPDNSAPYGRVDSPYNIDGHAKAKDYYPLTAPRISDPPYFPGPDMSLPIIAAAVIVVAAVSFIILRMRKGKTAEPPSANQ